MPSLISVRKLYDKVAVACGFPTYTNNTDTPDITKFILEMISEGLNSTIDILSTNSLRLNRLEDIRTIKGQNEYAVTGIIKHADLIETMEDGQTIATRLRYFDDIDPMRTLDSSAQNGKPLGYCIHDGYMRLVPTPDKEYQVKMEISTNDLVMADNDVYRTNVEHINDSIIGSQEFADVIFLRTCALILLRANSPTAKLYTELQDARIHTMIEKDFASNENRRMDSGWTGHYNPNRGLLG